MSTYAASGLSTGTSGKITLFACSLFPVNRSVLVSALRRGASRRIALINKLRLVHQNLRDLNFHSAQLYLAPNVQILGTPWEP